MYIYQLKIKLKSTDASAVALKILRGNCPNTSIGELRNKILNHEAVYATNLHHDGKRQALKILREFDKAGIETELFEETIDGSKPPQIAPLSREVLNNMFHRSQEIHRQVLEDIELENEGFISSEAAALIEEEMKELETEYKN